MAPSEIPHIPSNRPAVPATHLVPTLIYSLLKSPQGALLPPEHLPKAEVCPAHPAHWPSGDPRPPPLPAVPPLLVSSQQEAPGPLYGLHPSAHLSPSPSAQNPNALHRVPETVYFFRKSSLSLPVKSMTLLHRLLPGFYFSTNEGIYDSLKHRLL